MPVFLLQIVTADPPGLVARFPGGGPLERDFIVACTNAIVSEGVGLFRTEAQVKQAIVTGITQVMATLKTDSRYCL